MKDLNTLVPSDAPLYLLTAFSSNDRGEIAGFGVNQDGEFHGFVASPCDADSGGCGTDAGSAARNDARAIRLSDQARKMLLRYGFRKP